MKLLANVNSRSIEFMQKRILKIIVKNEEYFSNHLPAMQWLMCHWETMFYAGRVCYGYTGGIKKGSECEGNPKYEFDDLKYVNPDFEGHHYQAFASSNEAMKLLAPKRSRELYGIYTKEDFDAWREKWNSISADPYWSLYYKDNKTFDEWVTVVTDKRYLYHSLFETPQEVVTRFLCVGSSEYSWNADGYLAENDDKNLFAGWQATDICDMPKADRAAIEQMIYSEKVQTAIARTKEIVMESVEKHNQKDRDMYALILQAGGFSREEVAAMSASEISEKYHEHSKQIREKLSNLAGKLGKTIEEEDREKLRYTHLNTDSPMLKMPANAHESYVKAAAEVAEYVLEHEELYREKNKECIKAAHKWFKLPVAVQIVRKKRIKNIL